MTTLAQARNTLLPKYADETDPWQRREHAQLEDMTGAYHAYFVFIHLPPEDKERYGSVDNHPNGFELCFMWWVQSGAAERFAKEHPLDG
jgi:hypothetical protein